GGDHEDGRFAIVRAELLEDVHAGHVGHHKVKQDQIVGGAFELLEAFAAVVGELDDVASFQGQKVVETFADIQFIVDDDDFALGAGGRGLGVVHCSRLLTGDRSGV